MRNPRRKDVDPKAAMTLIEHLEELRSRLMRCAIACIPALILGWIAAPWVISYLTKPFAELADRLERREVRVLVGADGTLRSEALGEAGAIRGRIDRVVFASESAPDEPLLWLGSNPSGIIYSSPAGPFATTINVTLILALLFLFPYLLIEIWGFISPGLEPEERRWGGPFVVSGVMLFCIGAAFAYFSLHFALLFFTEFIQEGAFYYNDMGAYLRFALLTMAAFGGLFQLPLVTLLTVRLGLVSPGWLAERRRHVFVALLVVAAIVTPTQDAFTLALMAGPLYLLFELSLALSRLVERRPADAVALEAARQGF